MPLDLPTITVQQFIAEKYSRRRDVICLMRSQVKTGSRVWQVIDILPGYPIEPDAIYPTRIKFNFTDDFGRRRQGIWSTIRIDELDMTVLPVTAPRPVHQTQEDAVQL